MKSRTRTLLSIAIATAFLLPLGIASQASAHYPIGQIQAEITVSSPTTILDTSRFYGPANSMTQTTSGEYLGFIRDANSHSGNTTVPDYGVMMLYNSTDGHTWAYRSEVVNITDRDVRNYAAGTTSSGRVIVFFAVYDVDNATWGNTCLKYVYSDNDGGTWSAIQTLSLPTIDGFVPTDGTAHGEIKVLANGRIGVTVYAGNGSGTHLRLAYSDDDGDIWNQVDISAYYPLPGIITEADLAYLGDNRIIAMSRVDDVKYSHMFSSIDNGATWNWRGNLSTLEAGASVFPPSLSTFTDLVGQTWALLFVAYGTVKYTYAYADDLMAQGATAWSSSSGLLSPYSPAFSYLPADPDPVGSEMYATVLFAPDGSGLMMLNSQRTSNDSNVLVFDITAVNVLTGTQVTIVHFVNIIGVLFAIGIVAAIALVGVQPLRGEEKKLTVKHLINMFVFIIIGMAMIRVYYSMFT